MEWREPTLKWIKRHLGCKKIRFLNTQEKRNRLDFLIDTILVEDSPKFDDYNRIALIDRPYNKTIHAEHRITTPQELKELCLLQKTEQHRP